jgi:hypothetical protein
MGEMNIETFKGKFNGGARSNIFRVNIPKLGDFSLLCKAAPLPEANMGTLEAHFRGRILKTPGDREFSEWGVSFYGDDKMEGHKKLTDWSKELNDFINNTGEWKPEDIEVAMLDRQGKEIAEYKLYWAWPSSVGQIALSSENRNTLAEFECTFQYTHYDKTK